MNINDHQKKSSSAETNEISIDKKSLLSELFKILPSDAVLHEAEDMHPYE